MVTISKESVFLSRLFSSHPISAIILFFLAHPRGKINGISLSKGGAESYNENKSKTQLSRDGGADCVPGQAFSLEV